MCRGYRCAGSAIRTFLVAVVLNFAWEMAQAPLYEPMGTAWQATRRCFVASLGDGVMILLVATVGAVMFRSATWFARPALWACIFASCAGLALAVVVEHWGLANGRWAYLARMPRVPGTDVGAVPLLQMVTLTPVSLWLGSRWCLRAKSGVAATAIRHTKSGRRSK